MIRVVLASHSIALADAQPSTVHFPGIYVVVLVVLAGLNMTQLPAWWSGARKQQFFGSGWLAMQLVLVFMALGSIAGWMIEHNILAGAALDGVALVLVGLFLLSICLAPIVMLFNKPAFMVPPWLRGQPGKWKKWWDS
jgi:hypothetical protein